MAPGVTACVQTAMCFKQVAMPPEMLCWVGRAMAVSRPLDHDIYCAALVCLCEHGRAAASRLDVNWGTSHSANFGAAIPPST